MNHSWSKWQNLTLLAWLPFTLIHFVSCQSEHQDSIDNVGTPIEQPDSPTVSQAPNQRIAEIGNCQIFPEDNFWNQSIIDAAVHPSSDSFIANIGPDTHLHPDFGTVWQGAPNGIPYTIVNADQESFPVEFLYADESDPGPYPIPFDAPREGGVNAHVTNDRHILAIQEDICLLYEMYHANPLPELGLWEAGSGAVWDLNLNQARPQGFTSADAAGLAILPGLVKYDEVMVLGEVHHAIRVTLSQIDRSFIPPASHSDGSCPQTNTCPSMGQKLRLKQSVDISQYPSPLQVILTAMKTYGIVVADTGGNLFISGAPDPRWSDDMLHQLQNIKASDFEVIDMGISPIPYD